MTLRSRGTPSRCATRPDGAGEDMDWRLFFSRVVLHGVVALLLGGLLLSLAVLVTRGQIARLLDLFD